MRNKKKVRKNEVTILICTMLSICILIASVIFAIACKLLNITEDIYEEMNMNIPEPEYAYIEDSNITCAGVSKSVDRHSLLGPDVCAGVASAIQDVPDYYLDEPKAERVPRELYYEHQNYLELSDKEKEQLASLIYLEARGESIECQYAVGSVVLNRYTTGNYDSVTDVIYESGQFEPAKYVSRKNISDVQIQIVDDLVAYGPTIPEYVTYFREGRYHNFNETEDYCYIDSTYFSYDVDLYNAHFTR